MRSRAVFLSKGDSDLFFDATSNPGLELLQFRSYFSFDHPDPPVDVMTASVIGSRYVSLIRDGRLSHTK